VSVEIPPRGNSARHILNDVDVEDDRDDLPDHLVAVEHPNHTAICRECQFWITVGPDGTEYGHARRDNRSSNVSPREPCSHRPSESVDPGRMFR
jgi:hypothetical protein